LLKLEGWKVGMAFLSEAYNNYIVRSLVACDLFFTIFPNDEFLKLPFVFCEFYKWDFCISNDAFLI
jgi:hypothetical protein